MSTFKCERMIAKLLEEDFLEPIILRTVADSYACVSTSLQHSQTYFPPTEN